MRKAFLLLLMSYSQGVSINTTGMTNDSSAILDVSSNDKGVLIPRMTTAERNSISTPAVSLLIYNTTSKCFEFYENSTWQTMFCSCTPPSQAVEGVHAPAVDSVNWIWNSVAGATGYKWNTVNDYATASDLGTDTSYLEISLTCNTSYTRYIWAYSTCGHSGETTLTQITDACPVTCPTPLVDVRDGQSYPTVQIGTQCWMAKNLNYDQSAFGNDYCYDNIPANCTTYGRLYNWAATMQGAASSNSVPSGVQGVCPAGWHVPSDAEWCILENYIDPGIDPGCNTLNWRGTNAGGSLKETGLTHWISPNTGATDAFGFVGLPGGGYSFSLGAFFNGTNTGYFQVATQVDAGKSWRRAITYNAATMCRNNTGDKMIASSVRCIKD